MSVKKILFVHGGILQKAGTETYMMSVFRNIDASKYSIDFLVFGEADGAHDQEVLSKGAKIFKLPTSPSILPSFSKIKKQLKEENYDIVHSHMNALNAPVLSFFKKLGVPVLISHSHGSKHFVENKVLIAIKERMKLKIASITPYLIACSKAAGDFLYGDATYSVINNGVNTELYDYDEKTRHTIRNSLGLEDKLVFSHIGRFNFQKNHKYLIDVFARIVKELPNAHLVLVGDGELKQDILNQIEKLKISEQVTLLGVRDDIPTLLQGFDVFLMPSVFEGLPFALVEAQASGLQCFAADTIDANSKLLDTFHFLPLNCSESWSNYIINNLDTKRISTKETLNSLGFDVFENVKTMERIYDNTQKEL